MIDEWALSSRIDQTIRTFNANNNPVKYLLSVSKDKVYITMTLDNYLVRDLKLLVADIEKAIASNVKGETHG